MHVRHRQDPLLGSVLNQYRIEALIGEGAAARVYRARHLFLDRPSAVKLLSAAAASTKGLRARFEREARALATISHPNVVSVFDFGFSRDGRPFLTMELLSGRTLADVMIEEGPLERARIMRIARQVASGLAEAHRHGIVHRDLKPANVMLLGHRGRERVKILDFGVARATRRAERELTGLDVIIGTPRYMAPEQVMNPTSVSPASDLYSLGVLIYEMLSGRAPFEGTLMEVLDQQMNHDPPPLSTTTGLERLVHQLLSKSPDDRPPDAGTVIKSLELMPDDLPTEIAMPKMEMVEEATVRDDVSPINDDETVDGIPPTKMLKKVRPRPLPLPKPGQVKVRRISNRERTAALLTVMAFVLGCSAIAVAAVSVQKRFEPPIVIPSSVDRR